MEIDRRNFLKLAGLVGVGIAAKPIINVLSPAHAQDSNHNEEVSSDTHYAMIVQPKLCEEDCTDCIEACHRVHNVPEIDVERQRIKWIRKAGFEGAFGEEPPEFLEDELHGFEYLVLCNHCSSPPCVRVCPTKATFKRKDGIVLMDYHRCIGCRFCISACPYGARSLNWKNPVPYIKDINQNFPTRTRGVVEKCNFCAERLAKGQQPACVEACSKKALVFGDLNDKESEVSQLLRSNSSNWRVRKPIAGTEPNVYYIM